MNYTTIPSKKIVEKVAKALEARNVKVQVVKTKEEALEVLKHMIPAGEEVMTGSSVTLEQIGFVDYLKGDQHPWKNLKTAIVAETDKEKQLALRKQSVFSNYFLGSANALTEDGQVVIDSASGSQIPSYAFTSNNIIWVVSANKIVPDLTTAMKRVEDYVIPLENEHMKSMGFAGTKWNYMFIYKGNMMPNRHFSMILIEEQLGF